MSDSRLHVLAELATTAFSLSGRHWIRHGGHGGRKALLQGFDRAVKAIPQAWTSPHPHSLPSTTEPERIRSRSAWAQDRSAARPARPRRMVPATQETSRLVKLGLAIQRDPANAAT